MCDDKLFWMVCPRDAVVIAWEACRSYISRLRLLDFRLAPARGNPEQVFTLLEVDLRLSIVEKPRGVGNVRSGPHGLEVKKRALFLHASTALQSSPA